VQLFECFLDVFPGFCEVETRFDVAIGGDDGDFATVASDAIEHTGDFLHFQEGCFGKSAGLDNDD